MLSFKLLYYIFWNPVSVLYFTAQLNLDQPHFKWSIVTHTGAILDSAALKSQYPRSTQENAQKLLLSHQNYSLCRLK